MRARKASTMFSRATVIKPIDKNAMQRNNNAECNHRRDQFVCDRPLSRVTLRSSLFNHRTAIRAVDVAVVELVPLVRLVRPEMMEYMVPTEFQAQMVDRDRMHSKMYQQTNRNGALIVQKRPQVQQVDLDRLDKEAHQVNPALMDNQDHLGRTDQRDLKEFQEDQVNQDKKGHRVHQVF
jgi:hypothetical protein